MSDAVIREKGIHFLNGIRESWRLKNRLFLPVLAQLFIVGLFTVVHVRVDETTEAVRNSTRLTTIQCHPIWVGGYQNESQWANDYTRAMPRGSVPVLKEIVGIVCLLMAVGMKIVVMQEMLRCRVTCQT